MRRLLLASLLVLAGCGGGGDDAATTTKTGTRTARAEAKPPPAPAGKPVAFRAADGVRLHGRIVPGLRPHAPVVVLVHQLGGGIDQWDDWIPYLHRAGYAAFPYASRSPREVDSAALAKDVRGAVAAVRRRPEADPRRVFVIGASIGASATAWAAGTKPRLPVRAWVGLSPLEDVEFVSARGAHVYVPHRLLLLADGQEVTESEKIAADAGRGVTVRRTRVDGHGVALLLDARVRQVVLGWLRQYA